MRVEDLAETVGRGAGQSGGQYRPEEAADRIACLPDDIRGHLMWPSNVPDRLVATLGPRSVNYGWYTTWNEPWIAVVTPDFADWTRIVRWHPERAEARPATHQD